MWPHALPLCRHRAAIQIPRLCPRSPFLHLYFYFSAKSPPCSLHPLLSPTGLPDQTSCHELREEPACLGLVAAFGGGTRHSGCGAGPEGPRDVGVEGGC